MNGAERSNVGVFCFVFSFYSSICMKHWAFESQTATVLLEQVLFMLQPGIF